LIPTDAIRSHQSNVWVVWRLVERLKLFGVSFVPFLSNFIRARCCPAEEAANVGVCKNVSAGGKCQENIYVNPRMQKIFPAEQCIVKVTV